jgi:HEAT repeat protein
MFIVGASTFIRKACGRGSARGICGLLKWQRAEPRGRCWVVSLRHARGPAAVVALQSGLEDPLEPKSEAEVREHLRSNSPAERALGINYARYLDDHTRYDILIEMIEDSDPQVRYAAVTQLATVGAHDRQRTLRAVRKILWNAEEDATVRAGAADVLGGLRFHEAYPDLEKLFHESKDWVVRFSIVAALGEMGVPEAFSILVEALESKDEPLVQLAAIGALGELGDERARVHLEPLMNSADASIVERARFALEALDARQGKRD